MKTRLKFCLFDPDRHGNPRYYVRKPGKPKIRIREQARQDSNLKPLSSRIRFAVLSVTAWQSPNSVSLYTNLLSWRLVRKPVKRWGLRSLRFL